MIAGIVRAALAMLLGVLLLSTPVTVRADVGAEACANYPELQAEVEGYISGLDGTYGVSVVSLSDGSGVFVNEGLLFPTASMYKLLVMYRAFQVIDAGYLSLDDALIIEAGDFGGGVDGIFAPGDVVSVSYALEAMITQSSNAAAWALTRAVGGWGVVESAAGELGMYNTFMGDDYFSTPNDLAHFFRLLAQRSLVSPSASDHMIDLLLAQSSRDRLPALLPEGAQVAHKTGELPGVQNDGGIVWGSREGYVIVVMSKLGDPAEQVPAEATISRMVYDYFGE